MIEMNIVQFICDEGCLFSTKCAFINANSLFKETSSKWTTITIRVTKYASFVNGDTFRNSKIKHHSTKRPTVGFKRSVHMNWENISLSFSSLYR